jgi:hypothetical protein
MRYAQLPGRQQWLLLKGVEPLLATRIVANGVMALGVMRAAVTAPAEISVA